MPCNHMGQRGLAQPRGATQQCHLQWRQTKTHCSLHCEGCEALFPRLTPCPGGSALSPLTPPSHQIQTDSSVLTA